MRYSEQGSQQTSRPSLLSNIDNKNLPSINILSSLENHKKTSTQLLQKKHLYWTLAVIAISVGAIALGYKNERPPTTKTATPLVASTKSNAIEITYAPLSTVRLDQTVSSSLPLSNGIDAEKISGLTAVIINDSTESKKSNNPEDPFAHMLATDEMATAPLPTNNNSKESTNKPKGIDSIYHQSKHTKMIPPEKTSPKHGSSKLAPQSIAINNVEQKNELNQQTKAAKLSTDSDITLLSALITHENTIPFVSGVNKLKVREGSTNGSKIRYRKHSQDIVERQSGKSTKGLLFRCKKLGGLEAKLCRTRICSGQWATESACTASQITAISSKKS